MNLMLLGAIAMACFIASLLFLRFWKTTHDRFFLYFAASFFIEACNRVMLGLINYSNEEEPMFYVLRLVALLIILAGIADKNWLQNRRSAKD